MEKTYYDILCIPEDANQHLIDQAYNRIVQEQQLANETLEQRKAIINLATEAYGVIGNPVLRAEYDKKRHGSKYDEILNKEYTPEDINWRRVMRNIAVLLASRNYSNINIVNELVRRKYPLQDAQQIADTVNQERKAFARKKSSKFFIVGIVACSIGILIIGIGKRIGMIALPIGLILIGLVNLVGGLIYLISGKIPPDSL